MASFFDRLDLELFLRYRGFMMNQNYTDGSRSQTQTTEVCQKEIGGGIVAATSTSVADKNDPFQCLALSRTTLSPTRPKHSGLGRFYQLREFISEQPELLKECKDWPDKEAQDEGIPPTPEKPKRGRNSTSSPAPTRSSSRRRTVEPDQGLPQTKYAWEFVRENKRWGYHKDGIRIVGPEPEDLPIEYKDVSESWSGWRLRCAETLLCRF